VVDVEVEDQHALRPPVVQRFLFDMVVNGSGSRVQRFLFSLGRIVQNLGLNTSCLNCGAGLRVRVWGSGFGVEG